MIEIINQMIPENLLETYGASLKDYSKDQIIFSEMTSANFYYQIKEGHVKMYNLNDDGKEFVQGFLKMDNRLGSHQF